ncbi:DUF2254 domain-containing protein [Nocardioides marinquilinus]|uniref:DUF2254 domain-containing protein n=1 Tax=Nocardioides marinquilinus TaxID=1210400 RepID=A0ABP9P424_9ACTN
MRIAASSWDWLRAQLWPIPSLALVVAIVAGVQLPRLDRAVDDRLPRWLSAVVFDGGPGAAQTVLDAISSSLITVTSLTFSLTVVTLQLASSQFSPRLLRTFTRDLFVQATLALFLATFVFSLAVLRLVRSEDGSDAAFVPRLSVTMAFLLVVASVFMLVLFLAHLTRTIRVETMLQSVHAEASATVATTLGEKDDAAVPAPPAPRDAVELRAGSSGLVTSVSEGRLLRAAVEADAVIAIDVRPGDQVVRGVPVGRAWRHRAITRPGETDESLTDGVVALAEIATAATDRAVRCGPERTGAQDISFGLRQLTDVANKALSPGINDPTTAIHAIGHLAALLCDLSEHDLGPRLVRDDAGAVRLVLARPDFDELLEVAIGQPRRYGAADPLVLAALYRLLEALAHRAPPRHGPVVRTQFERLERTVGQRDLDDAETAVLHALGSRVRRQLDRSR